ncbi:MAG: cyclic pyranopterin monophosphate synthase MoaC [Myxococcales bacterium]|jgi:cyclic pyranopterin phosphate synthase
MSDELTHLDARGRARMVDVGDKDESERLAVARGRVRMQPETLTLLTSGQTPKGDVLATARIAGIQAAKRTPELIPLCHAIRLTSVKLELTPGQDGRSIEIEATVRAVDRTGVEMEALTAVSVAALTVYDMLKAVDRAMTIEGVALQEKRGGRRGDYQRQSG